ncbi:MAG: SDR family oxidoreductase [Bryobacteraceae bacterium]|nr:SDR family oxidoreductase [Bryobacteraceae bacterium]
MKTTLIIGATGVLGSEVVRRLRARGESVRALVRSTSAPGKVQALRDAGAETVHGDLKVPQTLATAMHGVTHVISTASATLSAQEGDDILTVDRDGQRNAIAAAHAAGVQQFVLVSFPETSIPFPLQDAKREVEMTLMSSGLPYTVLRPTHFWEVWCSPPLGFDARAHEARIFGSGNAPMNWISFFDVAEACVLALDNPRALNCVLQMGGPEPLTQLDLVRAFEAAGGQPFSRDHVPIQILRNQHEQTHHLLEKSFAALMLIIDSGEWVFDSSAACEALGLQTSRVARFAESVYSRPS